MDEYSALAQRVAMSMDDVRGCLLLSRDGLVLGAFPEDGEATLKPSWLKFVAVGDARRSFVEFGDQIWAYIHRGAYAAFVVAEASVRPGILLDQLEQALLVAEEARQKRDTLKVPDAAAAPSGKPRTSLHPPADRPAEVTASAAPAVADVQAGASGAALADPASPAPPAAGGDDVAGVTAGGASGDGGSGAAPRPFGANPFAEFPDGVVEPEEPAASAEEPTAAEEASPAEASATSSFPRTPQRLAGEGEGEPEPTGEIDRVMLAKEFSGLLQLDADPDEENS